MRVLVIPILLAAAAAAMAVAPIMAAPIRARNVDCTVEVEKMQPCLAFVENQISIPGSDCCKALLSVHLNSPVCLCKLLSASSSSSVPSAGVNITSALLLPKICNVHTDPSRCPALLAGAPDPGGPGAGAGSPSKAASDNLSSGSLGLVWSWLWSGMAASVIVLTVA